MTLALESFPKVGYSIWFINSIVCLVQVNIIERKKKLFASSQVKRTKKHSQISYSDTRHVTATKKKT